MKIVEKQCQADRAPIIKKLKSKARAGKLRSFIVADIETVLNEEDKHVPYAAAGVMRVDPTEGLPSPGDISWWVVQRRLFNLGQLERKEC